MPRSLARWCAVIAVGATLCWPSAPVWAADSVYQAIRTNDLRQIEMMVRTSADANVRGDFGNTLLMSAAAAGSVEAMKLLIAKGADVSAQNTIGTTALMMSATDRAKVQLLLDSGANVQAASQQG